MKITFWGTRGSLPVPAQQKDIEFCNNNIENNFGGNTTCLEIRNQEYSIFTDAGSGISRASINRDIKEYTILLSHLHWDHICGLNFFAPMFTPGVEINFYAVHNEAEESIRNLFNGVNFPIKFEKLPSKIKFHTLQKYNPIILNKFEVTPFELDHPGKAYGYRIEHKGRKIATVFDTEFTRKNKIEMGEDAKYYENLDMIIFDSQYTLVELVREKMSWGHASGDFAIDLAFARKIPYVVLIHHDPWASFEKLNQIREQIKKYYTEQKKQKDHNIHLTFARDGMEIEI